MTAPTQLTEQARKLGYAAGSNCAEWVAQDSFGGRVTSGENESAQSILDAIAEGDPAFWDSVRLPDLSGEYAGDPTPQSLAEDLGIDSDADGAEWGIDEACTAYEEGVAEGFQDRITELAKEQLSEE
jgi:hypothetical protein